MAILPGTRLGPYEVLSAIGAGGMGEVYRARDTKLNREVAIKALPPAFAHDAERLARFQREAQALAALNHPNIATIYGLEHSDGTQFLAMELVPGKSPRGPMPVDEALELGRQLAEALEAAHEKGIVHRDLKPDNIKITPEGKLKVLDFGLAKAMDETSLVDMSNSPTLTAAATRMGVILGTAAYMSPEQARGKPVDRRTDIWAFGCVLYEWLSGRQAFGGETVTDCTVAIMTKEPDLSLLPATTPPRVCELIGRCLQKDPQRRLRHIGDAGWELEKPTAGVKASEGATRNAPWFGIAALILVAVAIPTGMWLQSRRAPPTPKWSATFIRTPNVAYFPRVSPDGRTVAFVTIVGNQSQVGIANPERGDWTILTSRTDRGAVGRLSWSRDGSQIYFERVQPTPRGVYEIPVLGGEERLVLEDAGMPEVLPDDSLLVVRVNAQGFLQLHHFWPATGRLELLPGEIPVGSFGSRLAVFPDGKEVAFLGFVGQMERNLTPKLVILDLEGKRWRSVEQFPALDMAWPVGLGVTPDGQEILASIPSGDLDPVVAIPRLRNRSIRPVLPLRESPGFIDTGRDGSLFLDQWSSALEFLRLSPTGSILERVAGPFLAWDGRRLPGPDNRILFPSSSGGHLALLIGKSADDAHPFVQTEQQTSVPLALLRNDEVAFSLGSNGAQTIAVASLADGRILRRLAGSAKHQGIESMASSPDGQTIYYATTNVWSIPAHDGQPRMLGSGTRIAVDPRNGDLIVERDDKAGISLVRMSLGASGTVKETALPVRGNIPLSGGGAYGFGPRSVSNDGKMVVAVAPKESAFIRPAVLDLATGNLQVVPLNYPGDVTETEWDGSGNIVAAVQPRESTIWRFRQESK